MPALPYRELRVEQSESVVNRPTRTRYNGTTEAPFRSPRSLQRRSRRFERWTQHSGPLLETRRITTPKRIPSHSVVHRVCGSAVRRSRVRVARNRAAQGVARARPGRAPLGGTVGTARLERSLGSAWTSSASSSEQRIRSERRASDAHEESMCIEGANARGETEPSDGGQCPRRRISRYRGAPTPRAATRAPTIAARFSSAGEGWSTARRRARRAERTGFRSGPRSAAWRARRHS